MSEEHVWTRGKGKQLSKNFHTKEFECHCGQCSTQAISVALVNKLQDLRNAFRRPLRITSGFRCSSHQARLRGKGIKTAVGRSTHEDGLAADVELLPGLAVSMVRVAATQFKALGISRSFIHVDMRTDKERLWHYAKG